MKKATKAPPPTAVTVIPTQPETVVTSLLPSSQLILITETPTTIKRFDAYDSLDVISPIAYGKERRIQLTAVHAASMEIRDAINAVDKERKRLDEDDRERIKCRMAAAKSLWAILEPKRARLEAIKERVEAEDEAERVSAKTALHTSRKTLLLEAVGDYTDILLMWPDDLSIAGQKEFDAMVVTAGVHATGRKQLAEQQAAAKIAADKLAAEKIESDRLAEAERMRLRAVEDAERLAEQAKLKAEREAFEAQQAAVAVLQRKAEEARVARQEREELDRQHRDAERLAEQNAKLAAERAELDSQRMAIEDERRKQEVIRQAAAIEAKRKADYEAEMERIREQAERDADAKRAADQKAEEDRQRQELLRPDLDKLFAWITSIEEHAADNFPAVGPECEDLLTELNRDLSGAIDSMRGRLT